MNSTKLYILGILLAVLVSSDMGCKGLYSIMPDGITTNHSALEILRGFEKDLMPDEQVVSATNIDGFRFSLEKTLIISAYILFSISIMIIAYLLGALSSSFLRRKQIFINYWMKKKRRTISILLSAIGRFWYRICNQVKTRSKSPKIAARDRYQHTLGSWPTKAKYKLVRSVKRGKIKFQQPVRLSEVLCHAIKQLEEHPTTIERIYWDKKAIKDICIKIDQKILQKILYYLLVDALAYGGVDGRVEVTFDFNDLKSLGIMVSIIKSKSASDHFVENEILRNENIALRSGVGLCIVSDLINALQGVLIIEANELYTAQYVVTIPAKEIVTKTIKSAHLNGRSSNLSQKLYFLTNISTYLGIRLPFA